MSKLILFSKFFKEKTVPELIAQAGALGLDGYDLCVRPGYPINPDNASVELPKAVNAFRAAGLDIPMVTGNFDLLLPDHPTAEPIVAAMGQADVRLLKLGYFMIKPDTVDYWAEVDRVRKAFAGWETLGRKHGVKICYHTHSDRCMGLNAAALAHLLRGFDPQYLGAYLDPCHLCVEGEEFSLALAMMKGYVSIIGLKDVLLVRQPSNGHGTKKCEWVTAGEGMVNWTTVFADLKRVGYAGPLSAHCEFHIAPERFLAAVKQEIAFFRAQMNEAKI